MASNSSENSSASVDPLGILLEAQITNSLNELLDSITTSYIFLHTLKEQKLAIAWLTTIEQNLSQSHNFHPLRKQLLEWLDIMILSRALVAPFNKPPIPSITVEILHKIASEHNTAKIFQEIDLIHSERLHARELNDSDLLVRVDDDDSNEDIKPVDDSIVEPDWLQGARQLRREVKRLLKEYYYGTQ